MAVLKYGVIFRQYVIIIIANFTFFNMGLTLGWISPLLVMLMDPKKTVLSEPLSANEGAWLVSAGTIVSLISMTFTGSLINYFGRKICLVLCVVPRIILCIIFFFATQPWLMIFARAVMGMSDSMLIPIVGTYFTEIASKEIRGALGTISQILSSIGSMIMLMAGPFVSYSTLNIIHGTIVIGSTIPMLFLPESPYYLYLKGKKSEAIKVLTYLRGSELSALEEIKEYTQTNNDKVKIIEIFKDKILLKTVCKVMVLSIGVQLSGYNSVFMYLQTIFETTNTNVSSGVSSAIIGCVQLLACFCTMFIVDKFGRKPIMTISLIGMTIGMCGLGTFFHLTRNSKVIGWLNYLPIVSMILVIYCFNAGIASIVWVQIAELFDSRHRPFGMSFAIFWSCTMLFFTLRFFPSAISSVGPAPTYFTFGVLCALMCLFIALFVPETKGKAYSEIQRDMGRDVFKKEVVEISRNVEDIRNPE